MIIACCTIFQGANSSNAWRRINLIISYGVQREIKMNIYSMRMKSMNARYVRKESVMILLVVLKCTIFQLSSMSFISFWIRLWRLKIQECNFPEQKNLLVFWNKRESYWNRMTIFFTPDMVLYTLRKHRNIEKPFKR